MHDQKVLKLLKILGLFTKEDNAHLDPTEEEDEDLKAELNLEKNVTDERTEKIKSGIEHNVGTEDEMFGVENA